MKSALLSQKFHSRGAALIMIAVAAVYVALSGRLNNIISSPGDSGFAFEPATDWAIPAWCSLSVNAALNLLIMLVMVMVNRAFNVLRAMSWLNIGLFAIMQGAVPRELIHLNSGTLVCLGVIVCIYLLFSCYDDPGRVRTVFLAFLLLSLGCSTQYCFVLYIPVFWIVCLQMRIFSLRTFIASLLGILTVWVILFGFGIITPAGFHLPDIVGIFDVLDIRSVVYLITVSAITAFLLVLSLSLNVMKTIAYNARSRAFNGALTVVPLVTIAAMIFDFNNLLSYLPLLNMCAAYQLTHYFVNHRYERQYIAVLAIAGIYIALYLWRLSL